MRAPSGDGGFQLHGVSTDVSESAKVVVVTAEIGAEFFAKMFFELITLMKMMEVLDCLLEADGDEEADGDGGDVDEKVGPGVFGFVRDVDINHELNPGKA